MTGRIVPSAWPRAYASIPIGPYSPVQVQAQRIGHTLNVTIPGNPLDVRKAARQGWKEPVVFMHGGANSWYVGRFPENVIGLEVGHVVDSPAGASARHDLAGPLDPLRLILDWIPGLVERFPPVNYVCSLRDGCYTADPSLMPEFDWWPWVGAGAALAILMSSG